MKESGFSIQVWREVCVCVGQPILVAQAEGANVHLWHLQNAFNHQITTKWILINDDYTQIYMFWHFTDTPSILVLSQFLIIFFQRSNVSLSLELSEKWKHLIWPRLYRHMRQNTEIHFATWMAKRALYNISANNHQTWLLGKVIHFFGFWILYQYIFSRVWEGQGSEGIMAQSVLLQQ